MLRAFRTHLLLSDDPGSDEKYLPVSICRIDERLNGFLEPAPGACERKVSDLLGLHLGRLPPGRQN